MSLCPKFTWVGRVMAYAWKTFSNPPGKNGNKTRRYHTRPMRGNLFTGVLALRAAIARAGTGSRHCACVPLPSPVLVYTISMVYTKKRCTFPASFWCTPRLFSRVALWHWERPLRVCATPVAGYCRFFSAPCRCKSAHASRVRFLVFGFIFFWIRLNPALIREVHGSRGQSALSSFNSLWPPCLSRATVVHCRRSLY